MSFSNTKTGDLPADPYKEKNLDSSATPKEKIDGLLAFIEKCKFCMMTTRVADSGMLVSRCMGLAGREPNTLSLIFHANSESGKTDDLQSDPHVNLAFLNVGGEWASISGTASIETDRAIVNTYYSPALKAWFGDLGDGKHDGGPNDPRLVLIKVKAITAQYAISDISLIDGIVEVVKGSYGRGSARREQTEAAQRSGDRAVES